MVREGGLGWVDLADRSRAALDTLTTLRARVEVQAPARGFAGDAVRRSVSVAWATPGLWRLDDGEGLLVLHDGRRHVERDSHGVHQRLDHDVQWRPDDQLQLGWGHPRLFLNPPAFRTALRGPVRVEVAGRAAWQVLLAAPGNKPYPVQVAIDEATGLVLQHSAEGTPYGCSVLELVVDEPLPPDTFCWDGPISLTAREAQGQEHDDKRLETAGPLPTFWPTAPVWDLQHLDDDTLLARLHPVQGIAVIHRRPSGAPRPADDELRGRAGVGTDVAVVTWQDPVWAWAMVAEPALDDEDVGRVRRSVGRS